jgi:hypothetical protein
VQLRLDDENGTLLDARRSQPEIVFAWSEVERMERVRVFGLPLLGEGVRITLKEVMYGGIPRRLRFFSGTRARTNDIPDFTESRGVKVKRRVKYMVGVP